MNRQIGWSQEANLLHAISKELDKIIKQFCVCPTTTTTTTLYVPTTTTTTTIEEITTTTTTTEEPVTTTTTTTAEPFFMMKMDTLDNADLMIGGDATNLNDWNTFFNLPTNGTPFDNIQIVGTAPTFITLYGGGNMTLSAYLFGDNDHNGTSLMEVVDNGVVVECEDGVYSWWNIGGGLYSLTRIEHPNCITLGNYVFDGADGNSDKLTILILPFESYINLGNYVFANLPNIDGKNFSSLIEAGNNCFDYGRFCRLIDTHFPSLQIAGNNCFEICGLTSKIFPSLLTTGSNCFDGNVGLTLLNIPVCTNLGGTTGNDNVFANIIGKTITITIPHALESDGDIVWLKANNTVTVLYSD